MKTSQSSQATLFDETELTSISSAAGSPVRTLASLEKGLVSRVKDLASGSNIGELLGKSDPDGSSLRMCQQSLLEAEAPLLMTLPRSGMIVSGNAYQRQPLARSTDATDGGALPTPQARDYFPPHNPEYIAKKRADGHGMSNLNDYVAHHHLWPTPVARDCRTIKGAARAPNATGTEPLTVVVGQLENTTNGALNPTWVEWLMGFPLGWTDLEGSATP